MKKTMMVLGVVLSATLLVSPALACDGKEAKQWFRNDPQVLSLIEEDGVFGLGPDVDKAYFEANQ